MPASSKPRNVFFAALAFTLVVALLCAGASLIGHGNITGVNYARIRVGMPVSDAIAILGNPSSDLLPLTYEDLRADENALQGQVPPWDYFFWHDGSHAIQITTDESGRVLTKSYSRDPRVGRVRRLIDWLGL